MAHFLSPLIDLIGISEMWKGSLKEITSLYKWKDFNFYMYNKIPDNKQVSNTQTLFIQESHGDDLKCPILEEQITLRDKYT